jgi:glutamate formiminotransferase/formiminotetrahydrofolate cyclodeaminase
LHGWVECVPNFSEGQDERLIAELEASVRSVPGVVFLRSDPSPDHNRTLFTFAGPGRAVRRAAFNLVRLAVERIDLTRHIGVHPRMGAVDVVPFVPLGNTSMESASETARKLGEEVAAKLGVPVFLYEESATRAERRSLAELRKGGFEGHLAGGFPVGPPDFGPPRPHPTAGSVAIGARFFLIALNVILDTNDLDIARTVARSIRESARGLAAVRALGLPLASQGLVQVSVNILDYRVTSMTQVMERVREEAGRLGTAILESELIGLVPRAALASSVWEMLRLPPQRRERVVEDAVDNSGAFTFAQRLAAATPTPGSGAAAARAALHAASLVRMVAGLGRQSSKVPEAKAELGAVQEEAQALGKRFRALEVEDEESFERFIDASRAAAGAKAAGKPEPLAAAARSVTEVPLSLMETVKRLLDLLERLLARTEEAGVVLRAGGDLGGAVELARAASRIAGMNVRMNLGQVGGAEAREFGRRLSALESQVEESSERLSAGVAKRFIKG